MLLTEFAIREPVGGREVMRGQIVRLAEDDPAELASCWRAFEHLTAHAYRPARSSILLRQTTIR